MTKLRTDMPPLPARLRKLHVDDRGYPVPFFVAWVDGKPDFRTMDGTSLVRAVKFDLCWICGEPLGRVRSFLVGPMCTVNRTTAEPPSHVSCADFAVKACPFLTRPMAKRNERDLPSDAVETGIMIKRNPGVTAQWFVERKGYKPFDAGDRRVLFRMADPTHVVWWREGRSASRDEIMEAIETGLPKLEEVCDGDTERALLARQMDVAMKYLPPVATTAPAA